MQRCFIQVRPVLHGIHPRSRRSLHGSRPVGMGHDGKALLVGNVDQLPDFVGGQALFRQNAEAVKVHQAGDHDLHKVRALFPEARDHGGILPEAVIPLADEAAVVACFTQRCQGRSVADAVLRCQLPGLCAHAPTVAAVAQVGKAQPLVILQPPADQGNIGRFPVAGYGGFPIPAIKNHMHMTVTEHTITIYRFSPARRQGRNFFER